MNDAPPSIWSKRFRETAWAALASDFPRGFAGLYWFATGRRVRGWRKLMSAVASHPDAYAHWIRTGEEAAFDRFRQVNAPHIAPAVTALILVENECHTEVNRSTDSLRAAFGAEMQIYSSCQAGSRCARLPVGAAAHVGAALSFFSRYTRADWLLPLPAGDVVSHELPDALSRSLQPSTTIAYWDEDVIDSAERCDPWIKPAWDHVLFRSRDGLTGAGVISLNAAKDVAKATAHLPLNRRGFEQLSSVMAADCRPRQPLHIPLVLTHRHNRNRLSRQLPPAPPPPFPSKWPKVSVLLPVRDRPDLLRACLGGLDRTSYGGEIELVVIDNGSVDPQALLILAGLKDARVLRDDQPFNFSRLNNLGASVASGDFLCCLNNDVEPLHKEWLSLMVAYANEESVGAVGALLLYPSGKIQHAGVAIGLGGAAGHVQRGVHPADERFRTWHQATREVSAVTAAAMIVRKSTFDAIGGFDEIAFPVAFNDVDLCLRLKRAGFRNIFVAEAHLLHRESESRGSDSASGNSKRFARELQALRDRWRTQGFEDPHYSPLFSKAVERCMLAS